jgi:predicted MPP superfamily phosphohydrolase
MTRATRRRRSFVLIAALAVLIVGGGIWAFWLEPASLTVVEDRVTIPWRGSGPLRIALLTDLHIGSPFNGIDKLRDVVRRTNAANPDIICLLGDLVIQGVVGGRFVPPEEIAAELQPLHARSGTFAVLGNHDGWFDHDRVARAVTNAGITIVEERAVRVHTSAGLVWIAGVSDLWTGVHDVKVALASVTDNEPVLLMTHNPDVFPTVPDRVSLTLAGHTHGGQVLLPFVGRPIVPSRFGQRYAAGHVIEGNRHMYVGTGVGTSIVPVRFRVPPTVVIVRIESQPPPSALPAQATIMSESSYHSPP